MRVGVLTGGGDCPGLNAVIRAAVRSGAERHGWEFVGFREGWRGPMEGLVQTLDVASTRDLLTRGGTVLGSSRTNPYAEDDGEQRVRDGLADAGVDALIAIGGEDTLGVAARLAEAGVAVVGVPKTIDNDLRCTDVTFGFDTAVSIATEACDRLRTTAESHRRVIVVEVMGRHAGHIALHAGMAGGADVTLVPEHPFDIDEVASLADSAMARCGSALVVASEGAVPDEGGGMTVESSEEDDFGHKQLGGIAERVAEEIERRTGHESRSVVLGHVQRGGIPTAYDRRLTTRFGLHAVAALADGETGVMTALQGTRIVRVPISEAVEELKLVTDEELWEARQLFG